MDTLAVVFEAPERLALSRLRLDEASPSDIVVDVEWSGISTGTERLLFTGDMPPFPGMGYPLVPGYESVGRVAEAASAELVGRRVFVPGARCFGDVRGLFGGAARRVVLPAERAVPIAEAIGENGVLLALAATARHALAALGARRPDLVVGHGALGRLIARIALLDGGPPPTVWERDPVRAGGAEGYRVLDPSQDERRDYQAIYDVSGDSGLLDTLIARLGAGGEITLAGFYAKPLAFAFPPAFMREARLRVAAEWKREDIAAVLALVEAGRLSLDGLISARAPAGDAAHAYRTAFTDPACLKMVLDWRDA
jgi:3-hydroxyethyl bacteriochlorophyllide a dehydrogenase